MTLIQIHHQPEPAGVYLGSPSLVVLGNRTLVACFDHFGDAHDYVGAGVGAERPPAITMVFRSEDGGQTWQFMRHIHGAFWSSLFVHHGDLYLLGNDRQYGSIVIRRSDDGGVSWTHPRDSKTGLLFRAGATDDPPNYHGAPVPVCIHEGRIYRAFEDNPSNKWPAGFEAAVISAPADADLLDAENWTMSEKLAFDPAWYPSADPPFNRSIESDNPGWLEGNIVVGPDGQLWNVMRTHMIPHADRAMLLRVSEGGKKLSYDAGSGLITLPGGSHKFTIRRDGQTGWYFALANNNTVPGKFSQRNVLSLVGSPDLRTWHVLSRVLEDVSGLKQDDSLRLTGFQYADWQFDGEDIVAVVRTAYRGSPNFHDSNRITFKRVARFRQYVPAL